MLKPGLLIKVVLTLLVLTSLYWLTRVGVADFIRLRPCAYIDGLGKGSAQMEPATLDQARALLLLARTWDPENPVVPEYLAQTDFILAQMLNFSPALQAVFLRKAIVNFDLAITLRPNSAYLWAARMTTGDWLLQLNRKLALPVDRVELAGAALVFIFLVCQSDLLGDFVALLDSGVGRGCRIFARIAESDRRTLGQGCARTADRLAR